MRVLIKLIIFLCILTQLIEIYEFLGSGKIVKILTIFTMIFILYEYSNIDDFKDIDFTNFYLLGIIVGITLLIFILI